MAEDEAAQPDGADQAESAAASEADAQSDVEAVQPVAVRPEADQPEADQSETDQPEADQPEAPVFPIRRKRRGGVLGAAMLGLEQALYGPRQNEIVMVADADGMPEPDFDVQLTADPKDSYVVMRKQWWRRRHHG